MDYEPEIITATEDSPLFLRYYDSRIADSDHVYMPKPDADDPYAHWPEEHQP